jgi:hypothetical protein
MQFSFRAFRSAFIVAAFAVSPIALAGFNATGNPMTGRYASVGAPLPGGRVLIAGGFNGVSLASGEIYDPATGAFTPTANSLSVARGFSSVAVLANGKVLIAGGGAYDNSADVTNAEIFDPATNTFTPTGPLHTARCCATATLLATGKVLVAGGVTSDLSRLTSAELYDPVSGTFSVTGSLAAARDLAVAARLQNGKVLITGGGNGSGISLASSELYDPTTGTFSATGSMSAGRDEATANLLANGKVLVAGGHNNDVPEGTAEIYDPATGTFSLSHSTMPARRYASSALLSDGRVLIVGGQGLVNNALTALKDAQIYDPATDIFSGAGQMASTRFFFPAVELPNGSVLVSGGYNDSGVVNNAELFVLTDVIFANGFE